MGGCGTPLSRLTLLLPLFLLVVPSSSGPELDPYRVLGLSPRASQAEIKRVYKRLAKEWHPDKNKHPGAEDMFIKITKSYEILSSEGKRSHFDRFGPLDDTKPSAHRRDDFSFDETFFHFPFHSKNQRDFVKEKHSLQFTRFVQQVVPESHARPYLIKITSDWCFNSLHIEPVWEEAARDMEALGVGVGVVDVGSERRLANHLGAHRTPSIVGVVSGRVTFFHGEVTRELLLLFVEELLPHNIIHPVNDQTQLQFLGRWHKLNKPHALLFDRGPTAPLLFKLTAFAHRRHVEFGFVDQTQSETSRLRKKFNINAYGPTLLLFKEDTERPADIIQTKELKRPILDEFFSNNLFLNAPRLTNQEVFNQLCPIKQLHRRRKFCVLLITDEAHSLGLVKFVSVASSYPQELVRFLFVYRRLQKPLCDQLLLHSAPSAPQVLILERRAGGKVLFSPVCQWKGSDQDKVHLQGALQRLQTDPSILSHEATVPELNDEFEPVFVVRWVDASCDYLSHVVEDILQNNWRETTPLLSLIFSTLFVLFGTVVFQAMSDLSEDTPTKLKAKDGAETSATSSRDPDRKFVEVTELTGVTYVSNCVRLRPGHLNIVLLLSNKSRHVLLRKFAQEVHSFCRSETLHFSFLNIDKHMTWVRSLLNQSQDPIPLDLEPSGDQRPDLEPDQSPDFSGIVMALNGHKKYLCLFKPVYTGEESSERLEVGEVGSEGVRSRTQWTLQLRHRLDPLGTWMERLTEGSLPRYHLVSWPHPDTITA